MGTRSAQPFSVSHAVVHPALGRILTPHGVSHVEPRVMDVLLVLATACPEPVSRDDLLSRVWGDACVGDDALTRCISILRASLHDLRARPRYIETLSKHGYRLIGPVAFDVRAASSVGNHRAAVVPIAVAVLPFANYAPRRDGDHLCDGFTDLVIARLSANAHLRVTSRTSSMCYKRARRHAGDIAQQLGVRYLVEGSLIRGEGRVRAIVQLIDAHADDHLWSETYATSDGSIDALDGVAERVSAAIARRLAEAPPST